LIDEAGLTILTWQRFRKGFHRKMRVLPAFCAKCSVSETLKDFTAMNWQVYMILCSDESFYTGITTAVERRFRQHEQGRGAKYFRGRKPLEIVYVESGHTRSTASRREAAIKALSRAEKSLLLDSELNEKQRQQSKYK